MDEALRPRRPALDFCPCVVVNDATHEAVGDAVEPGVLPGRRRSHQDAVTTTTIGGAPDRRKAPGRASSSRVRLLGRRLEVLDLLDGHDAVFLGSRRRQFVDLVKVVP
jgi:hypothetical protein